MNARDELESRIRGNRRLDKTYISTVMGQYHNILRIN